MLINNFHVAGLPQLAYKLHTRQQSCQSRSVHCKPDRLWI